MILRKNASLLDCSSKSSVDDLYDQWTTKMLFASAYIDEQGIEEANNILGKQYNIKLTFWGFTEPDLSHLHEMTCLRLGVDPDGTLKADEDRRKRKAELLKEFANDLKSFAKRAAYLSGSDKDSNRRLEQALEVARTAIDQATEDLQWMER